LIDKTCDQGRIVNSIGFLKKVKPMNGQEARRDKEGEARARQGGIRRGKEGKSG
jgi:hypothetical protein